MGGLSEAGCVRALQEGSQAAAEEEGPREDLGAGTARRETLGAP